MFKKKDAYVENHGMLNMGKDYHVYHMTVPDVLIACALGFAAGMVVCYAFFNSIPAGVVMGAVCAAFAPRVMNSYKKKKTLVALREQFRDLMDSLSGSYSAGKNTPQAFESAQNDLLMIYGEKADMVNELKIINTGLNNNISIESLLLDFAARSGLDDVKNFADVFDACNRKGGNIKDIVTMTKDVIGEKIDIEMEIETILSGNKNELNIMIVMPVVVVLMLGSLGGGTANENTAGNIVLKLVCIAVFVIAYLIGRKITDIKV